LFFNGGGPGTANDRAEAIEEENQDAYAGSLSNTGTQAADTSPDPALDIRAPGGASIILVLQQRTT